MANRFFNTSTGEVVYNVKEPWSGFSPIINFLTGNISGGILLISSFALLFISILFFRRQITGLLKARSPETFGRFFFKNQLKSFTWGLLTTAAIRSSTITTSLVVPIVAKKIVNLKQAAPFIMGANIGTTITAFIAAAIQPNTASAISIAHFLFNATGVMFFPPYPPCENCPLNWQRPLVV
ncbi:MAG: Na/Pi symporter [Cyclobacteriaceae bacterium]